MISSNELTGSSKYVTLVRCKGYYSDSSRCLRRRNYNSTCEHMVKDDAKWSSFEAIQTVISCDWLIVKCGLTTILKTIYCFHIVLGGGCIPCSTLHMKGLWLPHLSPYQWNLSCPWIYMLKQSSSSSSSPLEFGSPKFHFSYWNGLPSAQ